MSRMILTFLVLFFAFYFGIGAIRSLSGKEKWVLTKLISYSIMCAVLTIVVLVGFVVLF